MPAHAKYRTVTGFAQDECTKGIQKNTNMVAASYHVSRILIRNVIPTTAWPSVSSSSTCCSGSNTIGVLAPTLIDNTMGSVAVSRVHWLMLLETIFISAMGARSTERAQ